MAFSIRTEQRGSAAGLDPTVWVLEGNGNRAEIWPARGFNCFRWTVQDVDFLYADPQFLEGSSPTRTGIPILFPFPNRLRDGRFTWEGKHYQLPINDPQKKNAIHGFACQRPWRVVGHGYDDRSAWITGQFRGTLDAPDCQSFWPADYQIQIRYVLTDHGLRIEAIVENPDSISLPFGLGYHPYFRIFKDQTSIVVPAKNYWELSDCLPLGTRRPVEGMRDLNERKPFAGLTLDDVLTDLATPRDSAELGFRGNIMHSSGPFEVFASPAFRETVVFTPPHRQAFCIEPYTCTTDAINLQQRGVDAGLIVLSPGQMWTGIVELYG